MSPGWTRTRHRSHRSPSRSASASSRTPTTGTWPFRNSISSGPNAGSFAWTVDGALVEADSPTAEHAFKAPGSHAMLPTDSQAAMLPQRIAGAIAGVRQTFHYAVTASSGWTFAELRLYAHAVVMAGGLLGTLNDWICRLYPKSCCEADCEKEYDECIDACPGDEVTEDNLDCYLTCETKRVRCLADCPDWDVITFQ